MIIIHRSKIDESGFIDESIQPDDGALMDDDKALTDDEEDPRVSFTARDLANRVVLQQAGYDATNIQHGDMFDYLARKVIKMKNTRKRFVFRAWPRDPQGQNMTETPPGKTTSSGSPLWGATLYDFYRVNRMPSVKGHSTLTTGSKLLGWMKNNDELSWAPDEVAWAEEEENPREAPPCDTAILIESMEMRIRMGLIGKSMPPLYQVGGDVQRKDDETQAIKSIFDTASYPAPWPLIPFSYSSPNIEIYIPTHRLPKKLIVHDPWNLLYMRRSAKEFATHDWTAMTDIKHIYELCSNRDEETTAEKGSAEKELDGIFISPLEESLGAIEPPIFVVQPPLPQEEPIQETHLYLSPAHTAGKGNHSVVYRAEWEIPRSLLLSQKLCQSCMIDDAKKILEEEDGKDGSKKDQRWKEKSGILKKRLIYNAPVKIKVVPAHDVIGPQYQRDESKGKAAKTSNNLYTIRPAESHYRMEYEGPVRLVYSRVAWQSPNAPDPACPHQTHDRCRPPISRVTVTAKLSLPDDNHLKHEAGNYQKFLKHMFEHWTGYNIIPPLHDPTPVGAVVPQFYGYYNPCETNPDTYTYLSPIMLLEDCGTPVVPEDLSLDDRHECASLYYRFHEAGWVHNSVAERNILVQPGPLTEAPFFRNLGIPGKEQQRSFRLIDFGRSIKAKNGSERAAEEMAVGRLFKHMGF